MRRDLRPRPLPESDLPGAFRFPDVSFATRPGQRGRLSLDGSPVAEDKLVLLDELGLRADGRASARGQCS
jgi:hypothetical protein